MLRNMTKSQQTVAIIILVVIILLIAHSQAPEEAAPRPSAPPTTGTYVHLDGLDAAAGITIREINLWRDYTDRGAGIAGTGRHGELVELIRRDGDGVLVELMDGTRGWVTYTFIREYK